MHKIIKYFRLNQFFERYLWVKIAKSDYKYEISIE
jgi:hypothetical protein